jgi:hypothetical protein
MILQKIINDKGEAFKIFLIAKTEDKTDYSQKRTSK